MSLESRTGFYFGELSSSLENTRFPVNVKERIARSISNFTTRVETLPKVSGLAVILHEPPDKETLEYKNWTASYDGASEGYLTVLSVGDYKMGGQLAEVMGIPDDEGFEQNDETTMLTLQHYERITQDEDPRLPIVFMRLTGHPELSLQQIVERATDGAHLYSIDLRIPQDDFTPHSMR